MVISSLKFGNFFPLDFEPMEPAGLPKQVREQASTEKTSSKERKVVPDYGKLIGPILSRFKRRELRANWEEYRKFFINSLHPEISNYVEFDSSVLVQQGGDKAETCKNIAKEFSLFGRKYGEEGKGILKYLKKK